MSTALPVALLVLSSAGYLTRFSAQPSIGLYKAPFLFCCIVSLLLYSFAIMGQLETGLWFTVALGLGLFGLQIKIWLNTSAHNPKAAALKNAAGTLPSTRTTLIDRLAQIAVAIPFVVFYLAIATNFKFLLWDEFSYWASSAKIIFETNALFNNDSPIFFKSYPPLQQLFQYYFSKQIFWSEKNVLFAQTFWVLSALLCVAGSFVKKPLHTAVVFLTSCSFLYFFEYSYSTIYSDPLMGVCFAACLALAFEQDGSKGRALVFFIGVAALLLLKEIAVLLAMVSVAVFIISFVSANNFQGLNARDKWLACLKTLAAGTLGLIAVVQSWAWYVAKIEGTRDLAANSLKSLLEPALQGRVDKTIAEFIVRVLKPGYLHIAQYKQLYSPSVVTLAAAFILISLGLVYFVKKSERLKIGGNLLLITGGAVGYTLALLISYLLIFTEYEGIRLASFERYLSTYILAWLLIVYALMASRLEAWRGALGLLGQLTLAITLTLYAPAAYFKDIRKIESQGETLVVRQSTESFAAQIKPHLKTGDKIYFIAQKSNGLERTMFYYAMLPFTTSTSWCWSIGPKYFEGDVWTCQTHLQGLLKGFDYLALFNGDQQFWDQERALFDSASLNKVSGLFKINRENGVITSLSFIPPNTK
jgi:hypothetical protein